jgi:hypothetical protein
LRCRGYYDWLLCWLSLLRRRWSLSCRFWLRLSPWRVRGCRSLGCGGLLCALWAFFIADAVNGLEKVYLLVKGYRKFFQLFVYRKGPRTFLRQAPFANLDSKDVAEGQQSHAHRRGDKYALAAHGDVLGISLGHFVNSFLINYGSFFPLAKPSRFWTARLFDAVIGRWLFASEPPSLPLRSPVF